MRIGCATKHKALTGSVVGLPFDSVIRRYWDASPQSCWCGSVKCTRVTFPSRQVAHPCRVRDPGGRGSRTNNPCISSHSVLHCARHCVGGDKPKPISFGSHPSGNVPTHGEPILMGFFMAALPTAPPAIAVSLHGLLEREHWPRSHPPARHATCQRGMAQEGEASGDRHLPHRDNRCLLGQLGC
jgi:hypothetical protein